MASRDLIQKLFNGQEYVIWVDDIRLFSYINDPSDEQYPLVLRCVETDDFDLGKHFYYEMAITWNQWDQAEIKGNEIWIKWETGSDLCVSVWTETAVPLENL